MPKTEPETEPVKQPSAATLRAATQAFRTAESARRRADELLVKAHEDGWSFRELGRQCGVAHTSVRQRIASYIEVIEDETEDA